MKGSYFSTDVQEFLIHLKNHKVKYVIVGGEAVIYYGLARLTGDVDFFCESSELNSKRLYAALVDFWAGEVPGVKSYDELMKEGMIFQFGVPPHRIDLVNQIDGVTFAEAWKNRTTEKIEVAEQAVSIYFMGLDQLIKNKEASKRPKDIEDLKYLYKAREERK